MRSMCPLPLTLSTLQNSCLNEISLDKWTSAGNKTPFYLQSKHWSCPAEWIPNSSITIRMAQLSTFIMLKPTVQNTHMHTHARTHTPATLMSSVTVWDRSPVRDGGCGGSVAVTMSRRNVEKQTILFCSVHPTVPPPLTPESCHPQCKTLPRPLRSETLGQDLCGPDYLIVFLVPS